MSKEIITEIIEDLEKTVGLNWPNYGKINREKLIECWSEYREDPEYMYFGYNDRTTISRAYKNIFKNIEKTKKAQSWKYYILRMYNYKFCSHCKELLTTKTFISEKEFKCISCEQKYQKNYREEHIIERKAYDKKRYYENKEKRTECTKKWAKTLEGKESHKKAAKKYYNKNKGKYAAYTRKRQAAKLQRTPAWLTPVDDFFFEEIYALAQLREELTGIKWHVDHIIPLQGKLVSGLHIPSNLQVITATENHIKSNIYSVK